MVYCCLTVPYANLVRSTLYGPCDVVRNCGIHTPVEDYLLCFSLWMWYGDCIWKSIQSSFWISSCSVLHSQH